MSTQVSSTARSGARAAFRGQNSCAGLPQSLTTQGCTKQGFTRQGFTRQGFTLIELLVVIAIIALLAAILFPVFSRARENARKSSCLNNCKQIGIGLAQYLQDFDEVFPGYYMGGLPNVNTAQNASDPAIPRYKWMDCIYPYVKSEQVFTCPSDSRASKRYIYYERLQNGNTNTDIYGSYCINTHHSDAGAPTPPCSRFTDNNPSSAQFYTVSLPDVQDAAGTIYVTDTLGNTSPCDAYYYRTGPTGNTSSATISTVGQVRAIECVNERHLGTTNIAFVDGHCKALPLDKLAVSTPAGRQPMFTIEKD